jgi:hypothetical protein
MVTQFGTVARNNLWILSTELVSYPQLAPRIYPKLNDTENNVKPKNLM